MFQKPLFCLRTCSNNAAEKYEWSLNPQVIARYISAQSSKMQFPVLQFVKTYLPMPSRTQRKHFENKLRNQMNYADILGQSQVGRWHQGVVAFLVRTV